MGIADTVRGMKRAIKNKMNEIANRSAAGLVSDLKVIVGKAIRSSGTAASLTGDSGKLRLDFGLTRSKAEAALSFIVSTIVDNMRVDVKIQDNGIRSKVTLTIYILATNVQEAMASNKTSYVSHPSGELIPWLEWLLTRGTEVVIGDFRVVEIDGAGRSSLGKMVEGGSFRVDPQHAGTPRNNFITRAIIDHSEEIKKTFISRIKKSV